MKYPTKKQTGFTLIELAIVLSVIGIMAAVILPGLFQAREDAKYATAQTQLEKDFPSAIIRYVTRKNTCTAMTATDLVERGVSENSIWGSPWTMTATTNTVTLEYPIEANASNPDAENDLAKALELSSNVQSAAKSATGVSVVYRCN